MLGPADRSELEIIRIPQGSRGVLLGTVDERIGDRERFLGRGQVGDLQRRDEREKGEEREEAHDKFWVRRVGECGVGVDESEGGSMGDRDEAGINGQWLSLNMLHAGHKRVTSDMAGPGVGIGRCNLHPHPSHSRINVGQETASKGYMTSNQT